MRKEYNITVVLDDSQQGASDTKSNWDQTKFDIFIRSMKGSKPEDSLAHELGHVIGHIFQTPKNQADPRVNPLNMFRNFYGGEVTRDEARRIVDAESEAWEYAEMMRDIDQTQAHKLLDGYRKGLARHIID